MVASTSGSMTLEFIYGENDDYDVVINLVMRNSGDWEIVSSQILDYRGHEASETMQNIIKDYAIDLAYERE
jgi:hypothetical protein